MKRVLKTKYIFVLILLNLKNTKNKFSIMLLLLIMSVALMILLNNYSFKRGNYYQPLFLITYLFLIPLFRRNDELCKIQSSYGKKRLG